MSEEKDESCWTCTLQQLGGVNITGVCKRNQEEIPAELVDSGCHFWKSKEQEEVIW